MAIPAGALGNAFSEVVEKELSAKEQDVCQTVPTLASSRAPLEQTQLAKACLLCRHATLAGRT